MSTEVATMSALPKEIAYSQFQPQLPPDTTNLSQSLKPINNSSFYDQATIQFNLPQTGFLDPSTLYLRYKVDYVVDPSSNASIRGTPCSAPFARSEIAINGTIVESITNYNVVYNMLVNTQMNTAQKIGCPNFGFHNSSNAVPSTSSCNGRFLPAGATTVSYAFPLMNLLSGSEKLIPLFAMPQIQLSLTTDSVNNYIQKSSSVVPTTRIYNVELCYDQVNFGHDVETMVKKLGKFLIKASSWVTSSQPLNSGVTGSQDIAFSLFYKSIRSIFSNFGGTDVTKGINLLFDSFDPTAGNGDLQYSIAGVTFPPAPISTTNNKMGALMELKMAVNGGLHTVQSQNMSINLLEFNCIPSDTTTVTTPAKFWFGVNTEKFSTANALLSGVSSQASSIVLRLTLNTALNQSLNVCMILLVDALIEVDYGMQTVIVRR
jgi:hypothetical protein